MIPCIICDIDGTIADNSHRLHLIKEKPKNWKLYTALSLEDKPITNIIHVINSLNIVNKVFYCSGRGENERDATLTWLQTNRILCYSDHLFLRAEKDYRPDFVIKEEMLNNILSLGYTPVMAFEDRKRCVDMYRSRGLTVAHIAEGDF